MSGALITGVVALVVRLGLSVEWSRPEAVRVTGPQLFAGAWISAVLLAMGSVYLEAIGIF